jgi:tetratricopeptide (TPR) repeat protein
MSLLLGVVCAPLAARGADADVTAAWELLGRHLANDALAALQKSGAAGRREAVFAEAVVRMDTQPVTDAGLKQVEAQLTALAQGTDEIADASAYLIGRLYQAHYYTPDPAQAARSYEQLAARSPGSFWAQLGLVKLMLLRLYVLPDPGDPASRIAAAEALFPRLTRPELQRDAHIVLGRARLFHGQPMDSVLGHLVAADQIGGLAGLKRVELQLQIAELSRREKHWEQARVYFQRFLDENEVDGRIYTVKVKLKEMAAEQAAEARRP